MLTGVAVSGMAHAASIQSLTASGAPGADGWSVTLTSGNGSENGEFNGDSAGNGGGSVAGAGATAWALYANSGQTASATYSLLGGALSIGQTLTLDFDNGWVDNGGEVGVRVLSGSTEGLKFSFTGGNANYMLDNGSITDTGFPFTADGLDINFTLTASGQYSIDGGAFTGTLNNALTSIDRIEVFNMNAGGGDERNVFFNNMTVVPEPSSVALLGLGGLAMILRRRK